MARSRTSKETLRCVLKRWIAGNTANDLTKQGENNMKKLTLSLCAAVAMTSAAFAGETYSKESKSVTPPPCPQWYADNEFNLTLSGVYMWTSNNWEDDQYFAVDHGWGGAI